MNSFQAGYDRFYRAEFELSGLPATYPVWFASDDGIWLYVNGVFVGHWGGAWRDPGCVNLPDQCSINDSVNPVDVASLLVVGGNTIAVMVSNGLCCASYFDFQLRTQAVLVIHGWESNCTWLQPLVDNLRARLDVTADRVQCFKYDRSDGYNTRKGVIDNAIGLANGVRAFRRKLGLAPEEEVDLVAHSYGGLVARYYRQHLYGSPDGPIGSISMLGTPNEGVHAARVHERLCGGIFSFVTCPLIDWAGEEFFHVDLGSQAVKDMDTGSDVLIDLNVGFTLPESPEYGAHAGGNASFLGYYISGSAHNDCVVSEDSVRGPGDIFDTFVYLTLSHGAPVGDCDNSASLINSVSVVDDLIVTIKGNPAGGPPEAPVAAEGSEGPGGEAPMVTTVVDFVQPSESKTHQINVPSGLGDTAFVVYWLDADVEPSLGVTLRRPDGTVVNLGDPDVIDELSVTGDGFLYVLLRGFVMSAPTGGTWEVTVEGLSVPAEGQAYLVALIPDSQVVLSVRTEDPALPQGQPQVITATLFDDDTAIAATSISGQVFTPAGTEEPLTLSDDGTGADKVAGDLTYSGTFTSTADCGGYSVLVTATGDSSEGMATRQQMGFFQAQVPGDAVRDPCNPDDDEDLLTDADELDVHLTDPLDTDTDGDGCADGEELGPDETLGGRRDPLNPYDFFPDPDGSLAVAMSDIVAVVAVFGTSAGDPDYDITLDRTLLGPDPWDLGPPDGSISISEIVWAIAQFGHSCTASP